jgi:hypothetical protein
MKFKEVVILLSFIVSNRLMPLADQVNHRHVEEVNNTQGDNDPSRHGSKAGKQVCPGNNGFPTAYHQGSISQVEQVITRKQYPVDRISKVFVSMKQPENIKSPIPEKNKSYMNCNEISYDEV